MPAFTLSFLLLCQAPQQPAYDPLARTGSPPPSQSFTAVDATRERTLPLRVYLPEAKSAAPVVLWSHGLGGSCDNSKYLGEHWAARGYVAVFLQHPGSDESVWRGVALRDRMPAMQKAANGENLRLRCQDVTFVLDQLERWQAEAQHPLHGRLDLEHVGMCGHSFGALTTQSVCGQSAPLIGRKWSDARLDAALPMSPSRPRGNTAADAFAGVTIPWLLMTGTADDSPVGDQTPESRREVFPALPTTIDRYELVLDGANHGVFGEGGGRLFGGKPDPAHHRAILALSTAFWDTYLRSDAAAKEWLQSDSARKALAAADQWQLGKAVATSPATKSDR
ncbi:MAG: dienelactone hydrolase [Planctomycetes bacterium]|nr:dienelactone hydrolase [Planctomycetota bacterium]